MQTCDPVEKKKIPGESRKLLAILQKGRIVGMCASNGKARSLSEADAV